MAPARPILNRTIRWTTSSTRSSMCAIRRTRRRPGAGGIPAPARATASRNPSACKKKFDYGFRAHNTNVFPQRPDRAYCGWIDGGAVILDIADKARPKMVANWRYSPPFNGFCHTVLRCSRATSWW